MSNGTTFEPLISIVPNVAPPPRKPFIAIAVLMTVFVVLALVAVSIYLFLENRKLVNELETFRNPQTFPFVAPVLE